MTLCRLRLLVSGSLVALAVGTLSLGMSLTVPATADAASVIVTPAQALAIGKAYFPANNKANAHLDIALQDRLETGSAAYMDDASFRLAKRVALPTIGAFGGTGLKAYVPRQTGYPAVFVLAWHTVRSGKVSANTSYMLFRKASAKDRWRVASEPYVLKGNPLPAFSVDKSGYIPRLSTPSLSVSPAGLDKAWRRVQALAAKNAPIPAGWAHTPLLKAYFQHDSGDAVTSDTFAATPWAAQCVAVRGGALCFTSTAWRSTVVLQPQLIAQGYHLTISSPQDRYNAGGVPAGSYVGIKVLSQREAAIVVPAKGKSSGLQLLGDTYGPISGTGIRG